MDAGAQRRCGSFAVPSFHAVKRQEKMTRCSLDRLSSNFGCGLGTYNCEAVRVSCRLRMSLSSQYEKGLNGGESTPSAGLIREQLKRILAHPLFTNSKRYPVLLAYTVKQTLGGNAGELKERTIGVEAFGREPDYDVNLDPVVRMTAAEVRKRLVQYYYNPDHAGELVIELPVGSYVPSFREPPTQQPALASESAPDARAEASPRELVTWSDAEPSKLAGRHQNWLSVGTALLFAALIGFGIGRVRFPRQPTNLERFWEPVTATSNRITYCVGERKSTADHQHSKTEENPGGELNLSDVTTLARSIGPLVLRKGNFRVVSALDAEFTQLREGPIVLIGAFNNPWTLRITQDLPLGFEEDNPDHWIVDRKDPQKRSWTYQWQIPYKALAQDYAIVARFHDNVTGQPVIVLAGILAEGTEAASEVVSNPEYLNAMLEKLPKDWDRKNVEAVIETHVIEGHPGPPVVVAVRTW
jgi:hypothetical protein